jgi:hypothetical protein
MTNESQHTPGPWELIPSTPKPGIRQSYTLWHDDGNEDGYTIGGLDKVHPVNARLIAAAPELLEACEAALEQLDFLCADGVSSEHVKALLCAAIAKATGTK